MVNKICTASMTTVLSVIKIVPQCVRFLLNILSSRFNDRLTKEEVVSLCSLCFAALVGKFGSMIERFRKKGFSKISKIISSIYCAHPSYSSSSTYTN